jgi:CheY-like chemotaxis protein
LEIDLTPKDPFSTDRKPGILVVDDDAAVRDVLVFGLRRKGFAVWQAPDGRSGLKKYWRNRDKIDLVLLDIRMPHLDGPQTLIKLRKLSTRVHCCFITGDLGSYTNQALLDLGALAIFRKPLQTYDLAARLLDFVTDPILNPSFTDARRQTIRRRPACPAGPTPPGTVILARNLARPRSDRSEVAAPAGGA